MSIHNIKLPKLSLVTLELIDLLKKDELPHNNYLLDFINKDPVLVTLILKNANSASMGNNNVIQIDRAITLLGTKKILSICIAYQFESSILGLSRVELLELKTFMFVSSNFSKLIAKKLDCDSNLSWICSYILRLGDSIGSQFKFLNEFNIDSSGLSENLKVSSIKLRWIEQYQHAQLTECDFLAYFCHEFHLPEDITHIIKYSANPGQSKNEHLGKISFVVYLSNILAESIIHKISDNDFISLIPKDLLLKFKFDENFLLELKQNF